ncbi:hypothetical protein DM02DRAFT_625719 [Periconia macrospinosa]|uniref:Protein NO VEIN C-terminal domain-containing protein n=1 Tax=Periconia macrospinosa TaxID=97972 RepID=A0A2V1DZT1_9PLEO|nr:hypothetical protein DM02DRAFT_625719 [Periconia macrospinosa]
MDLDIPRVSWIEQPQVADPPAAETLPASEDKETVEVVVTSTRSADYRADILSEEASRVYRGSPDVSFPDLEDDPIATYGGRSPASKAYHRRIGALGELHTLECLNLPGFTRDENWQSTIRGEVRDQPECANLQNWNGVETADIVYTDRKSILTRWLARHCTGGLPLAMQQDRDFAALPIKYYLEVKTTPGAYETRFFLGGKQYKMMEDLAVPELGAPSFSTFDEVFVILRVYHVSTSNVATKIFVDPYRLRKSHLQFDFDTVNAMVRDHT